MNRKGEGGKRMRNSYRPEVDLAEYNLIIDGRPPVQTVLAP